MAKQTEEQVRYLVAELAIRLLVRAGDHEPERQAALRRAIQDQVPEADEFELRELVGKCAEGLYGMANLIEARREVQVAKGKAIKHGSR